MKNPHLIPFAAALLLAASGCDRQSPEMSKKLAELEQKNNEAASRQRELERELEEQKLASEREAIERERAQIEADREALEREQGDAAAAQYEAIRRREEELASREGKLDKFQISLEDKQEDLEQQAAKLSDKDRELAGREALPFQQVEQREPVADYGMFYDSLSSYGSWFETEDYGYVWQPVAVRDSNWRPYSRGRWACSDRGWTWISEEPFGWATYHYGRWALLRGRGWIWVPGSEWAPCWVSWRESDSHIGWAPLPPETLAYRGHSWDSTVDVQFGIGSGWFSFVEIRNFGSPIYGHCLPVNRNVTFIQQTVNITYIHIQNRQIICGGPKYKRVCDRIGRPVPFYRLDVDQRSGYGRESNGMRPRVIGDRLKISAPNMEARWNEGIRPKQIKGRMESVKIERDRELSGEIAGRYRQSRQEGRERAEESIHELGGPEKFQQGRRERLQESRQKADPKGRREEIRDVAVDTDRPRREVAGGRDTLESDRVSGNERPTVDSGRGSGTGRELPKGVEPRRNEPGAARIAPREQPAERRDSRPQRQEENLRVIPGDEVAREDSDRPREPQRQTDQPRENQQDNMRRRQDEQNQQRQQQEKQREAEQAQAREARRQAQEQERAQRQQQENEQRRQQERAQRQQQEAEQQREAQRQQERVQRQQEENQRQRQEENQRQRQQEENQRQQRQQEENQRQRQQEENQRQRQQEDNQRQRQQKDDEERRGKNRQ